MKKKWQIMNFFSGKQQTYNVESGKWHISADRWSDCFEATREEAIGVYKQVMRGFRKVHHVSTPKLHEII